MLIRNATIWRQARADVRLANGTIADIGSLVPSAGERVIDAKGAALLPGLHDHHIHLHAEAARRLSIACGPPEVADERQLARALDRGGAGWLRGTGYSESVAGLLTRRQLDALQADRPVRIQDRTGRMWFFNSRAIAELQAIAPDLPANLDVANGRLFDGDSWLRETLRSAPPDLAPLGTELARCGVTGLTDMSPANDPAMAQHFARAQAVGALPQSLVLAGGLALANAATDARLRLGPGKLHLHDADLPDPLAAARFIRAVHGQGRAVAIHCVTEAELVVALAALREAGDGKGDRIEHAGIAPDHLVRDMALLGVHVCSNPAFILARGDRYIADVEPDLHDSLYRLAGLRAAGLVLAAGSDAPYGPIDPWAAMRAAVDRRTAGGQIIGAGEGLSPEEALALYLCDPLDLSHERKVAIGAKADLVLLDRPWQTARERLQSGDVRLVIAGGRIIHDRIDEPPA